jgi:hypothetical protein
MCRNLCAACVLHVCSTQSAHVFSFLQDKISSLEHSFSKLKPDSGSSAMGEQMSNFFFGKKNLQRSFFVGNFQKKPLKIVCTFFSVRGGSLQVAQVHTCTALVQKYRGAATFKYVFSLQSTRRLYYNLRVRAQPIHK